MKRLKRAAIDDQAKRPMPSQPGLASFARTASSVGKTLALTALLALSLPALAQAPPTLPTGNAHAISMYNLGLTAYKQGSPESAIIFFRRACDIDPDLADAQYNLGVIYQSQKRLNDAVPRFQEVLRVKPADPDAHYQLGLCLIDLGKPQDARAMLAAIPPSDKHYADAQRRINLIDQGQVPSSPASPATQPVVPNVGGAPLSPPISQPAQPAYDASTQPATQPVQQVQPVQQLVTPVQPVQQPVTQVQPVAPVAPTPPTPILANSSVRVIATGFSAPSGLAFDRVGNLYIANFGNNTIDRISPDGMKSTFSSGANLQGPIGLAVDATGNVYVANYRGGTIARINPAGVSTVIATGFNRPYYLTLNKDGNLFVSQQSDNSVLRIVLPQPIGAKL
ncbi:MAG TPA: tetratricopeptide repeat protein [Planktothrix sp.]|jgi:hypothetical protein